jgi:hypothetical protein
MEKIDLKKELKHLYLPSARKPTVVDVPDMQFVMLDGQIDPGETPETSPFFQTAIGALYGISYTLKFISKQRQKDPVDYTVMALEGLWWTAAGEFDSNQTETWYCTMMMLQPAHITRDMYDRALQELAARRPNPNLARLRFERFREGLCLQQMHVGPYADEPRTLAQMAAFAAEKGYRYRGKHHEIYLGDPRRARPENLRTVLRRPVEPLRQPAGVT